MPNYEKTRLLKLQIESKLTHEDYYSILKILTDKRYNKLLSSMYIKRIKKDMEDSHKEKYLVACERIVSELMERGGL